MLEPLMDADKRGFLLHSSALISVHLRVQSSFAGSMWAESGVTAGLQWG
jgi:hypothetical protein